jgi:hypothetical protein
MAKDRGENMKKQFFFNAVTGIIFVLLFAACGHGQTTDEGGGDGSGYNCTTVFATESDTTIDELLTTLCSSVEGCSDDFSASACEAALYEDQNAVMAFGDGSLNFSDMSFEDVQNSLDTIINCPGSFIRTNPIQEASCLEAMDALVCEVADEAGAYDVPDQYTSVYQAIPEECAGVFGILEVD